MESFPFFDDGSVMALFAIVAALQVDWSDPVGISRAPAAVAIGAGPTVVDWRTEEPEIRLNLIAPMAIGKLQPMVDLSVTANGTSYAGLGLFQEVPFTWGDAELYFSGSAVAGYFNAADEGDDTAEIQYRGTVELGVRLDQSQRIGLSWDHRSGAGRGAQGRGLESLQLRYVRRF